MRGTRTPILRPRPTRRAPAGAGRRAARRWRGRRPPPRGRPSHGACRGGWSALPMPVTPMAPAALAPGVEDGRGRAGLSQDGLLGLGRPAAGDDLGHHRAQPSTGSMMVRRVRRGEGLAHQVLEHVRVVGQERLAEGPARRGAARSAPTSRICRLLSGRKTWWTTSTTVAMGDADAHRLAGLSAPAAPTRPARASAARSGRGSELPSWSSSAPSWYLSRLGVLLDQAVRLQRRAAARGPCPWRGRAGPRAR